MIKLYLKKKCHTALRKKKVIKIFRVNLNLNVFSNISKQKLVILIDVLEVILNIFKIIFATL